MLMARLVPELTEIQIKEIPSRAEQHFYRVVNN